MQKINLDKERAIKLDEMLSNTNNKDSRHIYRAINKEEFDDLFVSAKILEQTGYINILVSERNVIVVKLLDSGKVFLSTDSFLSQTEEVEENKIKETIKNTQEIELTSRQIRAYKREPYLIAWNIIATLAATILTFLQLKK